MLKNMTQEEYEEAMRLANEVTAYHIRLRYGKL